jgi:hypothetical protein
MMRFSDTKHSQPLSMKPAPGFQSPRFGSIDNGQPHEEIKEEDRTKPQFVEEAL